MNGIFAGHLQMLDKEHKKVDRNQKISLSKMLHIASKYKVMFYVSDIKSKHTFSKRYHL